jgi:hypothetical protein
MRCSEAKELINDFVDASLSAGQEAALRNHLERCSGCQEFLRDFQRIVQGARELPSVSPSPAAWQKIAAAVSQTRLDSPAPDAERPAWISFLWKPARLRYALAAALALVILGGGLAIGLRLARSGGGEGYTLAKLKEAQHHYVLAIKALDEAIAAQKNGVDPQLAAIFKKNLEAINGTIQAYQEVVEKNPNDVTARSYLLAAYREKVTFLEEMMAAKKASADKRAGVTL